MALRSSIRGLHCFARSRRGPAAFTLVEILVVLALIGLISALVIGAGEPLLRASTWEDAENSALSAIAAARHEAVLTGREIELRLDAKARALDWGAGRKVIVGDDQLSLLPPVRTGAMLLGGQLVEEPIALVRFYADGTCDAFRLEITRDGNRHVMAVDPWTCTILGPDPKSRTR